MENQKLINGAKEILKPFLEEKNLVLYDVDVVKEDGNLILRILIDNPSGLIDLNALAEANEYVSDRIDKYDADMPEYMLEVSSPGAEKVLRNDDEIMDAIGEYVHVEVPGMVYEGNLLETDLETVTLRINIKGRFKKQIIKKEEIKLIRLAVKI